MANRKLLSTDAINLKAKVKAEMLRRCQSGSVAAYGGAAYDFTNPPTKDGPVKGEHLKKILEPMRAINPDGLPEYPCELTEQQQVLMENKITNWAKRSITDRSASDCKSGCTGTCYSGCTTGCYTGCSSCSGCDGCSDDCDGCRGCGGACSDDCRNACTTGCKSSCDGDCKGCGSSCSSDCIGCDWLVNK